MTEFLTKYKIYFECLQYLAVLAGVLFAIWQFRLSRESLEKTSDIAQAGFALQFMQGYRIQDMSESLRLLRQCKDDFGPDFASVWYNKLQEEDPLAKEIDKARRHVKFYYRDAYMLYNEKLITYRVFKLACFNAGINLLYDIVHPLGAEIDTKQETFILDMKKIFDDHSTQVKPIAPSNNRKSKIIIAK